MVGCLEGTAPGKGYQEELTAYEGVAGREPAVQCRAGRTDLSNATGTQEVAGLAT